MDNKTFYGSEANPCVTYLEFGEINLAEGKKVVWDFRLHQKAYDWLMLGRYANDMLTYSDMERRLDSELLESVLPTFDAEIHHKDDFSILCAQLCALAATAGDSFMELGQTLFGCIDGMGFARKALRSLGISFPEVDLERVEWRGVDISAMFNQLAARMHPGHRIRTAFSPEEFQDPCSVFFAKGISLHYAVRSPKQFGDLISRGECAIFDYSLSLGSRQEATVGSGKTLLYLGVEEVARELAGRPGMLFVKTDSRHFLDTGRVWLECVYGQESACRRYMELRDGLRDALQDRLGATSSAKRLLSAESPAGWTTLDEYLASIGQASKGKA